MEPTEWPRNGPVRVSYARTTMFESPHLCAFAIDVVSSSFALRCIALRATSTGYKFV
jgi:hypothetical protein